LSLKSYFEVFVLGVGRNFFDIGFTEVSAEFLLNVADAVVDCLDGALDKHLDGAIRQIADKAGKLTATGYVKRRKAKADALHLADENYMFGNLAHYSLYINSRQPSIQAGIDENQIKVH
jgi:hypothetical protein